MRGRNGIAIVASFAALVAPASALAGTGGTAPPSSHSNGSKGGSGSPGSSGSSGGTSSTGGAEYEPPPPQPPPPSDAKLKRNGKAKAPEGAPIAVVRAIRAGNKLQDKPYRYGGGHQSFTDTAYDCSGTVSFALHGARVLRSPLDSGSLMSWGEAGAGDWITVYTNPNHAYMVIAGLRLDTSGTGGNGPRWQVEQRDPSDFTVRHPAGL